MKCEEIQPLHGAFLDSELDAKTALEIQQHLAACPDCARAFEAEAKLDGRVVACLRRGQRSAALWEQIEQGVLAAAEAESQPRPAVQPVLRIPWWRELLWPSPQAWAGLAAMWVVMLGVTFATREPAPMTEARQAPATSDQMRRLLQEQRQMLAELNGLTEQLVIEQPGGAVPQPRSQRSEQPSNT